MGIDQQQIEIRDPRKYTPEIGEKIAIEVAGGETIAALNRYNPEIYPTPLQIRSWRNTIPAFDAMMKMAMQAKADVLVDETLVIADDDDITPAQAGIRIRTRQWMAERLNPQVWGKAEPLEQVRRGDKAAEDYSDQDLAEIISKGRSVIEAEEVDVA